MLQTIFGYSCTTLFRLFREFPLHQVCVLSFSGGSGVQCRYDKADEQSRCVYILIHSYDPVITVPEHTSIAQAPISAPFTVAPATPAVPPVRAAPGLSTIPMVPTAAAMVTLAPIIVMAATVPVLPSNHDNDGCPGCVFVRMY